MTMGNVAAAWDQSDVVNSCDGVHEGAVKATRLRNAATTMKAKKLLTPSSKSVPLAKNAKPPKTVANAKGPGTFAVRSMGKISARSSPPLERYATINAKCKNANVTDTSDAPLRPTVFAAMDCMEIDVSPEEAIVDKATSAVSKPVVAM
mmetsp:Transcript_43402/g.100027  ORF Transcript_43402/g.100027 Transcript_43402/m.100027 type:complete len:149 (-) Transcript_43402:931-1377(-)